MFVSYKRQDRARVAPLVDGLRKAGLTVWWDREMAGGDTWRQRISEQLGSARCVIVVWTERSVGGEGSFVQDEAGRAKQRGVLLPVRLDDVALPLGFGEIQSLDLVGWNGSQRNRRLKHVVASARAVATGGPRPRQPVPGRRARLVAASVAAITVGAGVIGLAADIKTLTEPLCRIPGIHAFCGWLGAGGIPSADERVQWEGVEAASCAGLRSYLERYPTGAFAEEASRRLQARVVETVDRWQEKTYRLPLTVRATLDALEDEDVARTDAEQRAQEDARQVCSAYEQGDGHRLLGAEAIAQSWRCHARDSGVVCGFDGEAICQLEVLHRDKRERCG